MTRVTELLPVLMNDILNSAPEDQKVSFSHASGLLQYFNSGGVVVSCSEQRDEFHFGA